MIGIEIIISHKYLFQTECCALQIQANLSCSLNILIITNDPKELADTSRELNFELNKISLKNYAPALSSKLLSFKFNV